MCKGEKRGGECDIGASLRAIDHVSRLCAVVCQRSFDIFSCCYLLLCMFALYGFCLQRTQSLLLPLCHMKLFDTLQLLMQYRCLCC